jgi:hypothetical protein
MVMTSIHSNLVTRGLAAVVLGSAIVASSSCGEVARTGESPAFLIVAALDAASGAEPSEFGTTLNSDVQTIVEQQIAGQTVRTPTIFNDIGRASFRLGFKNPLSPSAPTTLNEITITRYRVVFKRADGRNGAGVDLPHGFDGAFTVTIGPGAPSQGSFDLVRHQHKSEPPLINLVRNGGAQVISTIADVTFYGRDQAGNEVSVTASISVNFADFGDPR